MKPILRGSWSCNWLLSDLLPKMHHVGKKLSFWMEEHGRASWWLFFHAIFHHIPQHALRTLGELSGKHHFDLRLSPSVFDHTHHWSHWCFPLSLVSCSEQLQEPKRCYDKCVMFINIIYIYMHVYIYIYIQYIICVYIYIYTCINIHVVPTKIW